MRTQISKMVVRDARKRRAFRRKPRLRATGKRRRLHTTRKTIIMKARRKRNGRPRNRPIRLARRMSGAKGEGPSASSRFPSNRRDQK